MIVVSLGIALVLNIQQAPPFEFKDSEKKVIIKEFFEKEWQINAFFKISLLVKGKATVKVKREKGEIMFSKLLTQMGCTYCYEAGAFNIIPIPKIAK